MPVHTPSKVLLHHIPLKFVAARVSGGGRKSVDTSITLVPFIDFLIVLVVFLLTNFGAQIVTAAQDDLLRLPDGVNTETLEEALALSDRLARRAWQARRPEVLLGVHAMRFRAYLQLGDRSRAAEENGEMLYIAHETRDVLHTWHAERHRALSALSRGEFDLAEQVLGALAPVGVELHGRLAELYSGTARVWLLRERGDLNEEMRARRDQLRPGFAHAGGAFRVQGLLLDAELGQTGTARRALEELSAVGFTPVLDGPDHVAALSHLAELCVLLRDRESARAVYTRLLPFGAFNAVDSLGHAVGSAHHFLGRLSVLLQRRDAALDHLLRAVDQNSALGMLPQLCRTRWQLAKLLLASERSVERERGAGLAAAVQHEAAQLGMRRLLDEIQSRDA